MVAVGSRQFGMLDGHCDHSIRHLSLVTVTVIGSYYKKISHRVASQVPCQMLSLISDFVLCFSFPISCFPFSCNRSQVPISRATPFIRSAIAQRVKCMSSAMSSVIINKNDMVGN